MNTSHARRIRSNIWTGKYLARAGYTRYAVLEFTRRHRMTEHARYSILNGYYSER